MKARVLRIAHKVWWCRGLLLWPHLSPLALMNTALPSFRLQCRRCGCDPWRISWRRKWQPAPVFLPGESHRQRSLAGFPWVGEPMGFQGVRQDSLTKQQSLIGSLHVPSTSQVYSFLGAFALSCCSFQNVLLLLFLHDFLIFLGIGSLSQ